MGMKMKMKITFFHDQPYHDCNLIIVILSTKFEPNDMYPCKKVIIDLVSVKASEYFHGKKMTCKPLPNQVNGHR